MFESSDEMRSNSYASDLISTAHHQHGWRYIRYRSRIGLAIFLHFFHFPLRTRDMFLVGWKVFTQDRQTPFFTFLSARGLKVAEPIVPTSFGSEVQTRGEWKREDGRVSLKFPWGFQALAHYWSRSDPPFKIFSQHCTLSISISGQIFSPFDLLLDFYQQYETTITKK